MFTQIIAILTSIFTFFSALFMPVSDFFTCTDTNFKYTVDTTETGRELPNFASDINLWEMGSSFTNPPVDRENDIFEFVEYVQLMNCTGGTESRDLFSDPLDRTVRDDYYFDNLITNCKGILKVGAKPCLILGNTPLKLTSDVDECYFSGNVYPPDDYNEYYNYIYAMGQALTDAFGRDEVLTWHFGVMTEYENSDWFLAKDKTPESTAIEYCKLYDWSVKALQDSIGENIYIGAHSMTVTEGLWDEEIFIKHCGVGTNYATGETGTRICYLSASFYDSTPEEETGGKTLSATILYLKNTAEKYGLTDLNYGIDEGRILNGLSSGRDTAELLSRSSGYTMQGAYDAKGYAALWDSGADYFSYWYYLSEGIFKGNPTVSYHVSKQIAKYKGMLSVEVEKTNGNIKDAEVGCKAAVDKNDGSVKFYIYNYMSDLEYDRTADINLDIKTTLPDGDREITVYRIDDDCNWFDEWCEDRITYNITDDCFSWSPDDGCINSLDNAEARAIYNSLTDKYADCSKLVPETYTVTVENGHIKWATSIDANTVAFFEIDA